MMRLVLEVSSEIYRWTKRGCDENDSVYRDVSVAGGMFNHPLRRIRWRTSFPCRSRYYDLFVLSVDGQMDTDGRKTKNLKPGFHLLNVVSSKPGRRGELTFQPLPLTVEPCVRYRFVAKHAGRLDNQRWEPMLVGTNTIPGCNPGAAGSK